MASVTSEMAMKHNELAWCSFGLKSTASFPRGQNDLTREEKEEEKELVAGEPLQKRTRTETHSELSTVIMDENSLAGVAAQLVALKDIIGSHSSATPLKSHSDSSEVISCSSNSENESPNKLQNIIACTTAAAATTTAAHSHNGQKINDSPEGSKDEQQQKQQPPRRRRHHSHHKCLVPVYEIHSNAKRRRRSEEENMKEPEAETKTEDERKGLGLFKVKIVNDLSVYTIPPEKKRLFRYQFL